MRLIVCGSATGAICVCVCARVYVYRPFFDDAVCLFACMVAQSRTVCGCLGWAVWVIVGGDGLRGVRCVIVLNEIFETERERIELRPGSSHHVK